LRVTATDAVAQSYHELGQLDRAKELLRQNIEAVADVPVHETLGLPIIPKVGSLDVLAWCLSWQGNFREAIETVEESVRIAEAANIPLSINLASGASGLVYALHGDVLRAITALQRCDTIMQPLGRRPGPAMAAFLGYARTLAGEADEAVSLLERSLEGAAAIKFRPCTSLWTGWLAGAYLQAGRNDDARQTAERAVQMGRDHHERGFEGMALRELGDVIAATESPDVGRAEDLYHQALTIGEELGMRPLQAHTHLSLGKLYRRAGREHEARAELNVAIDLYLSMEMTHWLPEAEAELAALPE
jgi:tetratricopeptide (TPR) repeat protein